MQNVPHRWHQKCFIIFIFGLLYNVDARDVCILSITTVLAKLSA